MTIEDIANFVTIEAFKKRGPYKRKKLPMPNKTIHDFLMNAKSVRFFKPTEKNEPPIVFIVFEDFNTGVALYTEVDRTHKTKPQYLGFKKSHSSLIVSFIIEETENPHAKMLLDYDEKEFDDFVTSIKPDDPYVLLFGDFENGMRRTGGFQESPVVFQKYRIE